MDNYTYGKLCEINYNIQVHEGNANRRFCSQIGKILYQVFPEIMTSKNINNKKEFETMRKDILTTLNFTRGIV